MAGWKRRKKVHEAPKGSPKRSFTGLVVMLGLLGVIGAQVATQAYAFLAGYHRSLGPSWGYIYPSWGYIYPPWNIILWVMAWYARDAGRLNAALSVGLLLPLVVIVVGMLRPRTSLMMVFTLSFILMLTLGQIATQTYAHLAGYAPALGESAGYIYPPWSILTWILSFSSPQEIAVTVGALLPVTVLLAKWIRR